MSKLKLVYLVPVVAKKQSQFVHAHLNRLWSPTAIILATKLCTICLSPCYMKATGDESAVE